MLSSGDSQVTRGRRQNSAVEHYEGPRLTGPFRFGRVRGMQFHKRAAAAVAALGAQIKGSMLNNLDRLIRRGAAKSNLYLKSQVADLVFGRKTPGAFGNPTPPSTRPRFKGNKIARYCAARGKVRGY